MFAVYEVTLTTFKFATGVLSATPPGMPSSALVTFLFDKVLRDLPANTRVNLGPGVFQTRGYALQGVNSWQPKAGQKLVGAGMDVTTIQLVGASVADQHYHAIGMNVSPNGTTPPTPIDGFEISDLTVDCNIDNQPLRAESVYTPVACGAVRIFGSHCKIRRVKAINWGTKTFKEGCFVMSIIDASAETSDGSGQPVAQETTASGIEDCVAVQPASSIRETTVLHIGGRKNPTNHAQAFATAPFIRRNFVDCGFKNLLNGGPGTKVTDEFAPEYPVVGVFVGKHPHSRPFGTFETIRCYNPLEPASRWNGYFPLIAIGDEFELYLDLAGSQGTTDDSSLVLMGTEYRAIAVTSAAGAVVEQNQIHNCWIGGPYSSPLDNGISQPSSLTTLAQEERLDPLNALSTRSLIVRNNFYKNVAVGPYWNMGGVSGTVPGNSISYDINTGLVTVSTASNKHHKLWLHARVKIEFATAQPNFDGIREITPVSGEAHEFQYQVVPNLPVGPSGTASYRVVSGVDYLTIENNVIELADLDETEFGIKDYPLVANAADQTYRAYGIVVADNEISALSGPYAHRQVFIRNNKIRYVDGKKEASFAGLGPPVGAAMQLAGIKQLHVTHNLADLNAPKKVRTFRIGTARFFHNTHPDGEIIPHRYDEPESLADDAFILSLFERTRR
jgi:hypothetical protein